MNASEVTEKTIKDPRAVCVAYVQVRRVGSMTLCPRRQKILSLSVEPTSTNQSTQVVNKVRDPEA